MFSSLFNVAAIYNQFFLRCFRDPIWIPRIRENYHRVPEWEKIRFLESEKSGPYQVPNIFLKKSWYNSKMFWQNFILIWYYVTAGLNLKFASCWDSWGYCSCPRSANCYGDTLSGLGLNIQPFDWDTEILPLSYCCPQLTNKV